MGFSFFRVQKFGCFWGGNGKVYSSTTTAPISIKICAGETAFDGQQQGRIYEAGFFLVPHVPLPRNFKGGGGKMEKNNISTTIAPISMKFCAGETVFNGEQQGRVCEAGF